jgi:hypothetical protein
MLFAGGDAALARAASKAGIDRIVVDLERREKRARQHGYHLQCSTETLADLRRMRRASRAELVCRINPVHPGTPKEIEAALKAGADALMLPMFRRASEVKRFLELVRGRATTILLFETPEALALAPSLDPASFDEAYVGLNDLSLAFGKKFSYELLTSGEVDRLRRSLPSKPMGFGGLTVLDGGAPLPTRQIVGELARLRCSWTILRRAFKRDIAERDLTLELRRLRAYHRACLNRSSGEVRHNRKKLKDALFDIVRAL